LDAGETLREAVDEFQVRQEGVGHVLVEEGLGRDDVEGYAVGAVC